MKNIWHAVFAVIFAFTAGMSAEANVGKIEIAGKQNAVGNSTLKIGWAQTDLTPSSQVMIGGQFYARISESVLDPITATAMVIENGDHVVFVSCDFVCITDELRDKVRIQLKGKASGLDSMKVILNATHTHTGPELRQYASTPAKICGLPGIKMMVKPMPISEYVDFAAARIARAVVKAWNSRTPAKISFGVGQAVVGHNRRWVDTDGVTTMYGKTNTKKFSHIEGYEDHSVNIMAARNLNGELTGLIVNVPCPSQVTESLFSLSADYWHETRLELRKRFGEKLFILPQCSAAGDISPHLICGNREAQRMLQLSGRTERQEIAKRISDAAGEVLQTLKDKTDTTFPLEHYVETMNLPAEDISKKEADEASINAKQYEKLYKLKLAAINANKKLSENPRWYVPITDAYNKMQWHKKVTLRFNDDNLKFPAEIHIIRLGEIVFATNPFEYYLDFGIYIKARSSATQTFLVQLAGEGTYVPSLRSTQHGGYGSKPESNPVGPKGGQILADETVKIISQMWAPQPAQTKFASSSKPSQP